LVLSADQNHFGIARCEIADTLKAGGLDVSDIQRLIISTSAKTFADNDGQRILDASKRVSQIKEDSAQRNSQVPSDS